MYVYRATLYCNLCGTTLKGQFTPHQRERCVDSDLVPQYYNSDYEGESDCPEHCDECGQFLENPLTSDGYRYVHDLIIEGLTKGGDNIELLREYGRFYQISLTDLFDRVQSKEKGITNDPSSL